MPGDNETPSYYSLALDRTALARFAANRSRCEKGYIVAIADPFKETPDADR